MKLLALLASLAFACATTANATECTQAEMKEALTKPEIKTAKTACNALKAIGETSTNAAEMDKKLCSDTTCVGAIQDVLKILPDCKMNGVNMKETFQSQLKMLEEACQSVPKTSSASSSAIGLSVATGAAVAVFVQM